MNNIYFAIANSNVGVVEYIISAPTEIVCKSLIVDALKKYDWYYLTSDEDIDMGISKTEEEYLDMFKMCILGIVDEKYNQSCILHKNVSLHNNPRFFYGLDDE